jgi:hypothetical protein
VVYKAGCHLVLWLAVIAIGCDDHGSGGIPADTSTCGQLGRQISDALAVPGSCNTDDECSIIGGQTGFPTCDCAPYVLDCSGMPIASNAPGLPRARVLIQQFISAGCAVDKACDCAPRGRVHCTADHHCTAAEQSCFPEPIDAGMDAPFAAPG